MRGTRRGDEHRDETNQDRKDEYRKERNKVRGRTYK